MKHLRLISLFGATALVMFLAFTSCKKSGNSSQKLGTLSFTFKGQNFTMNCVADTTYNIAVTGIGVLPGSKDSVGLYFDLVDWGNYIVNQYEKGLYSDTAQTLLASGQYYTFGSGGFTYTDAVSSVSPFNVNITSFSNGVLSGTFSGMMTLWGTTPADSAAITNGRFSVQL